MSLPRLFLFGLWLLAPTFSIVSSEIARADASRSPVFELDPRIYSRSGKIEPRDDGNFDLDELLEIWNPITVANIWKSRRDAFNVTENCEHDVQLYLRGALKGDNWALKLMDADGKHTWGLFWGSRYWLGSSELCRAIDDRVQDSQLGNDHDEFGGIPPFRVTVNSVNLQLEVLRPGLNGSHNVTLGLCLPSRCGTSDVRNLLNFSLSESSENLPRRIHLNTVRNLSEGYSFSEDSTFYVLVITSVVVMLLVNLGTCYDIALRYKYLRADEETGDDGEKRPKIVGDDSEHESTISKLWSIKAHNGTLDIYNQKNVPKPLSELLLSFSLLLNISKLASFDVGNDTLAPIHGLRFVSMLWVILIHTCLATNEISDSQMFRKKAESDFLYQTISNGTYAVDTFFFISGCLVAFLYFRTIAKQRMKELRIVKGYCGQFMQFLGMMAYRYFRLTPVYLLVLGLVQVSMKWYHDHVVMLLPSPDGNTCKEFWWRNALYINTFYPLDGRCMIWSWYLANDTQFYTVGIVILIISVSFFKIGAIFTGLCLVGSWITTAFVTFNTQHIPTIQEPFAHYESLYDKPWTRIGPYLIGMATGWFLFEYKCKLRINKVLVSFSWFGSLTLMFSIVYGLYGEIHSPLVAAIYTSLSHSAWALSLSWILIGCVTGHGGLVNSFLSWKYIYPLSRLTYCAYLVHPALMRGILLRGESSLHLTEGLVAMMFFGFVVSSYGASVFLSLFFEAPMVSMLRIVHPMRRWKSE